MKPEWKKYTGSDEQIAEMKNATNGFVFRYKFKTGNIEQSQTYSVLWDSMLHTATAAYITHYLICQPHPYADMICQWARTGQPVYIREHHNNYYDGIIESVDHFGHITTSDPDWNIPGAEYSFTPFDGA